MNMKLSYRDKIIFIGVIVVIIIVAGIFLFIKPKFAEIDKAKYNLETKQQEKADIDEKIATLPDLIDNIKNVAKEIDEMQSIFLEEQDPYLNEIYIREALSRQNLEITSMNTAYTLAAPLNRYTVSPANVLAYENKMNADLYNELPQEVYDEYNNVGDPIYPDVTIGVTTMELSFKSDLRLSKMYDVINRISEDEKTITLNSVVADIKEENGTDRDVTCNLTLYSVYPLNVEQVLKETAEIKPIETPVDEAAE